MRQKHFITRKGVRACFLFGIGALAFTSCAQDGFDDSERFVSEVTNSQVNAASGFVVTPSADGKSQTISWDLVKGADGHSVSLYNEDNLEEPIVKDTIVDGCTVTFDREEDVNYLLTVYTRGNKKNGNSDAADTVKFKFTTFMPASVVVPDGTDLYAYFAENPLPAEVTDTTIIIDLEAGGNYTLTGPIDFLWNKAILRTASKTDLATIKFESKATIQFGGGFTMRYLHLDCAGTTDPVIQPSATPNEAIKGAGDHYIITDPITIQNCYIENVTRKFLYDNKLKYCIKTFTVDNCQFKFTTDTGASSAAYFEFYDGGGFINDFYAVNSTFWNTTENSAKYFIRYNNSGRCDRAGFTSNSININNCTFYNIAKTGQMANHGGFDGRKTSEYEIKNNIFVDCGSNQVARRIVGRVGDAAVTIFNNNTYWFDGAAEAGNTSYDTGIQFTTDPAFVDAANGDFTPTGEEQVANQTGDPRWLTAE